MGHVGSQRTPHPEGRQELVSLFGRLAQEHAHRARERPELPNFLRLSTEVPGYDQPGILARNEFDTLTTCGNCALVCFETLQKRARALKSLRTSGIVIEAEGGELRVVKPQDREAAKGEADRRG